MGGRGVIFIWHWIRSLNLALGSEEETGGEGKSRPGAGAGSGHTGRITPGVAGGDGDPCGVPIGSIPAAPQHLSTRSPETLRVRVGRGAARVLWVLWVLWCEGPVLRCAGSCQGSKQPGTRDLPTAEPSSVLN